MLIVALVKYILNLDYYIKIIGRTVIADTVNNVSVNIINSA